MGLDHELFGSRLLDWLYDQQVPIFLERERRAKEEETAAVEFLKQMNPRQHGSDDELLRLARAHIEAGRILEPPDADRIDTSSFLSHLGIGPEDGSSIAFSLISRRLAEGFCPLSFGDEDLTVTDYPELKTPSGIETVKRSRAVSRDVIFQEASLPQRLLMWMSSLSQPDDQPVYLANFLASQYASFEGRLLFNPHELQSATTYLVTNRLLVNETEEQHQGSVRFGRLSDEGRNCAMVYRGDIPRYLESRQQRAWDAARAVPDELGFPGWLPLSSLSAQEAAGHAFISYVWEDSDRCDGLQQALEVAGVHVWRDKADLWPGQDWRAMIRHAITDNALAFIACFSTHSAARAVSYQNAEVLLATEQLRLRPPGAPWLIPVRLDDCQVPDFDIGGGRTLESIQRVDLFGDGRQERLNRLVVFVKRLLGQLPSG